MKHLSADRPDWKRVPRKRFYCKNVDTPGFKGWITLLILDEVREPLIVKVHSRPLCLADTGYAWLQQFPDGEHYTVTTMFDAGGKVVQWYIDICLQTGADERNIPWLDDLYLDLAVLPTMEVQLLDADELANALTNGEITQAEYDLAWREARNLSERIAREDFDLLKLIESHRQMLIG